MSNPCLKHLDSSPMHSENRGSDVGCGGWSGQGASPPPLHNLPPSPGFPTSHTPEDASNILPRCDVWDMVCMGGGGGGVDDAQQMTAVTALPVINSLLASCTWCAQGGEPCLEVSAACFERDLWNECPWGRAKLISVSLSGNPLALPGSQSFLTDEIVSLGLLHHLWPIGHTPKASGQNSGP